MCFTSINGPLLIIVNVHEDSFTGEQFCDWLLKTFSDIKSIEEAAEWGRSLFDKGLIGKLGFAQLHASTDTQNTLQQHMDSSTMVISFIACAKSTMQVDPNGKRQTNHGGAVNRLKILATCSKNMRPFCHLP